MLLDKSTKKPLKIKHIPYLNKILNIKESHNSFIYKYFIISKTIIASAIIDC